MAIPTKTSTERVVVLNSIASRVIDGRRGMHREFVFTYQGKPFGKITFSGGEAEVSEESDSRSALSRADAALYEAKSSGRNRIVAV